VTGSVGRAGHHRIVPAASSAGGRGLLRAVLTADALLTFTGAVCVIAFGVIATSGVYGSRLAWLLGIAFPLLALTIGLSWFAARAPARADHGRVDMPRVLFVTAVVLLAIPLGCALALLSVYALLFVLHGVSMLF
jgi:hypothetical protein